MTMPTPLFELLALQDAPSGPNPLIMLGGLAVIFWFVLIMPERKERKRKQAMIAALKKNDRVLTTGGMYATVAAVSDNDFTLRFDDSPTRVRVLKSSIASVLTADDEAGSN